MCFSNTVFRQTFPPASLSSSSASFDPSALELNSAFTSVHVDYLYERGRSGSGGQSGSDGLSYPLTVAAPAVDRDFVAVVTVVAAAPDRDFCAVVAVALPDDGRGKIYGLDHGLLVLVVALS